MSNSIAQRSLLHVSASATHWFFVAASLFGWAPRLSAQWTNTNLPPGQRAAALVAAMTQAEQLAMVSGGPYVYIGNIPGNSRLGIPPLNFQDGPAGCGDSDTGVTAFPSPVCLAAAWDITLARTYGTYVGQEERGKGGQVILGPMMNMARAYQDGRNTEGYGEDPFLASAIASADVQGIQSQGVMANIKHFVCNDQETDRFSISADSDERTRQEIYYQPFRACVQAGVGSIMASYNRINGRHSCESAALNATVRKLWGFDGFILSDWAAYFGTATAANNGLDIDMYNGAFSRVPLGNAIAHGSVLTSEIADKVRHILTARFQNGDFDNPSKGNINAIVTNAAHRQFALDCAAAGTVLLQNHHAVLPLKSGSVHSIAVIGSVASTAPISTAYGSSEVVLPYNITPLQGIANRARTAGINAINFSQGDGGHIPAAVALARSSDVAILCVGQQTGESLDRASLSLPNDDDALISAVAAVNTNTIVVLYCSSATLMPWSTNIAASLVAWFPGQENGNALAQVLFGDVNPSGRLPVTFPAAASQVPANTTAQFPGVNGHAAYSEGLNIGYRWYDANNVAPLFPFGHGLSYTTFGYSNLTVNAVSPSGQVRIGFDLTNTGTQAGAEVPQLYLGFPSATGEPPKLLKGFKKVKLSPGESQPVSFQLDWQDLANWDPVARSWIVTPGNFQVLVGASSRDLRLTGAFTVDSVPSSDLANLALHQAVTASSGNNPMPVAVDGNSTTGWNSSATDPQWLLVDMGLMMDLSRVRLQWNTNYGSAYSIQLSSDASTWATIVSRNDAQGGLEDILVSGRGRYLRLLCTRQGVEGVGYGVQEFEVYAQPQTPFHGTAVALPARIEAEDFDTGGQGVGYHTTAAGNLGGAYRTNEDVGIEITTDTGGGYDIGVLNSGDWLEYTVNAPDLSAIYSLSFRVASPADGGQLRVRLDGALLGTANIPNTGGSQNWQTITLPTVPIDGGTGSRSLRLEVVHGGFNLNWIELDRVQLCASNNIALNQPTWASSVQSSSTLPKAAFDGDCRSYWWSSSAPAQWVMVDLGAIVNVARIRLDWVTQNWNNNGYGQAAYSQNYSLQFSTDGVTWTNAYSTTNGIGSLSDLAVAGNTRYVRMNSTQDVNGNGVGLHEFEVYSGLPMVTFTNPAPQAIANPSFEAQLVSEASYLLGDPLFWQSALLPGTVDALVNPGPPGGGEPWPSSAPPGLNGTNFCQIYMTAAGGGGLVYQNTGIQYQPGTTYQLTSAFGLQTNQILDIGSTFGFYNSALAAITTKTVSPTNLVPGAFTDQSVSYTATGGEGGNGTIIIGFYASPAAAGGSYFDFDQVRLVTTAASNHPPVIIHQPASLTSLAGGTVTFRGEADGNAPLIYQWQADGRSGFTNLVNGGGVAGATSSVLSLTNVTSQSASAYRLVVTSGSNSIVSAVATLTVVPFLNQPSVPDPISVGPTLAATVVGSHTAPPTRLPTSGVTDAPVIGNGDMAIMVGGPASALKFYVGKADFFGVLRGSMMPVGSLTLSAPALSGSSYLLNQNVGPATVTGLFANGASALSITSWVATAENTAVLQLNNGGSQPLSLTSQLLEGFAGSAGNQATYGSTNNSTWLKVSPDTVYLELGNQLHNALGTAPFAGKLADLRLFDEALTASALAALDSPGAPTPLIGWSPTHIGAASLMGNASLNPGDSHGGSVSLPGGADDEVAIGDLPLPENQFTVSIWVNVATPNVSGNIVTAQIPYPETYGATFPYPYVRGLTLKLVNGKLSATLNQSGYLDFSSPYLTFSEDPVNAFTTAASTPLPANQWVQAAVTYDGNTLSLFTNGAPVGVPVVFPTGATDGMMGWNKMVTHLGDTSVINNGCAPQGVLMQSVVGATATTNSQGALVFTVPAGGQAIIVLAAVTDRNDTNYFATAQRQTQQATTASLDVLSEAHTAWWSNFWSKSFVQIPNQKIQDNWYASLYLLACCSRSNTPAPGLWGNFITTTTPAWQGDYTLDYNYEAPFWGALACNHVELTDNYDQPLLNQISRGRATARHILGTNSGIYFYTHLIPSPGWSDDPGSFWGQKSCSLFAAVNCAMRWKYTLDTNYAAKVYPYLKGVADFWDSYLVLRGNQYMDFHDSAWEQSGDDTNPATTLSFIHLVYPALVQMSEALNVDAESRARWNDIDFRLAPLSIVPAESIASLNNLGPPYNAAYVQVIRASAVGTAFPTPAVALYHDHLLRNSSAGMGPCQVVYPGWNVGLESDPATLRAASNTIWLAAQWLDNNNACNFYPGAACVGYDPSAILSNLDTLLTDYQYPNSMLDLGGGGTEDYSIVPGTLAAMFVQSYQTNIHIFPNWPSNQSAAFGNFNACGGFLVSGAITLGSPNYVRIQSTAGQILNFVNPWPGTTVRCVSSLSSTSTLSGTILTYPTQPGEVLTLDPTSVTSLPAPSTLTAMTNGYAVALNWNLVPGAAAYNVKRSISSAGPFLVVASGLTAGTYTDPDVGYRTTYYYAVSALAPGFESSDSPIATVITPSGPLLINPSFEQQTVAPGSYAIENPAGWNVFGQSGGAVVAIIHPAPGDGRFIAYPPPGSQGENYCQIYMNQASGSATVYQDLGPANRYQPGVTYTLTAAFGLESGRFPNGTLELYNSELVALASKVITSAMLASNTFTPFSVTYTATGNEGGNGDIVVGFSTAGARAGTSFDIDNVRLSENVSPSTNAFLTSVTLSPSGGLTPSFASNILSYTAVEPYGSAPTVTVTDVVLNATYWLIYNGTTNLLVSGVPSAALALNPNPLVTNVVRLQVVASDGITKQTYTVNVKELPSQAEPALASQVSGGILNLSWPIDHLGYRLLVQTNNLDLGVSSHLSDWGTVLGTTTTNRATLSLITTNRNEYYRLVYP